MPTFAASRKYRRVRFPSSNQSAPEVSRLEARGEQSARALQGQRGGSAASAPRGRDLPKQRKKMTDTEEEPVGIPTLFKNPPPIRDSLSTETSRLEDETVEKCLPFLRGIEPTQRGPFNQFGVPALQRDAHVEYLYDSLEEYPSNFVGIDSSRPWMVYWALAGLSLLGEDVTKFRER